jgi:hypothetical protein
MMNGRASVLLFLLLPSQELLAQTTDEPRYKLDRTQSRVTELSNLYPDNECHPDGPYVGRVVKRVFDEEQGTIVRGFTIETGDGSRSYINVDDEALKNANRVTSGWVIPALQTLLKEGQRVSVGVKLCGAAGRVIMVDSIRPVRGR